MLYIDNFNELIVDKKEYSKQLEYFNKYYNDKFVRNQGTEQILEMVHKYCPGGKWLDVGCGSTTLFWSLMTKNITTIYCADYNIEALRVLNKFSNESLLPKCYKEVIEKYQLSNDILRDNKLKIKKYAYFNALETWPDEITKEKFDFITQFGLFGLCRNEADYIKCFDQVRRAAAEGAIIIGVNWILSEEYSNKRGVYNNYISKQIVQQACIQNNLLLLENMDVRIVGDKDYDRVSIWVAKVIN